MDHPVALGGSDLVAGGIQEADLGPNLARAESGPTEIDGEQIGLAGGDRRQRLETQDGAA